MKSPHLVAGVRYLEQLDRWGFDLFLYSCVGDSVAEHRIAAAAGGVRCATYGNYGRKATRGRMCLQPR